MRIDTTRQRCLGRRFAEAVLPALLTICTAVSSAAGEELLFRASFDRGMQADQSGGTGAHRTHGTVKIAEGVKGDGVRIDSPVGASAASLSWPATGNIDPERGTISFWVAPGWDPAVMRAPEIFAVRGAVQIYYEPSHPVIVVMFTRADGKLLVVEVKHRLVQDKWVHLTLSWDCREGAAIYIDGRLAKRHEQAWAPPDLADDASMAFILTNDLGGRAKVHPLGGAVDELKVFAEPLDDDRVARLFKEDGGESGLEHRYVITADFASTVRFRRVICRTRAGRRVTVRTASAPAVTWSALSWGGAEDWTRSEKVARDGSIQSPAGRHLRIAFTFVSPVEEAPLPVDAVEVIYSYLHEGDRERTFVLDPAQARGPRKPVSQIPLTRSVVTPHEKWGTPYVRGRIRALILTHLHNQREIVELAQRMDLDFDTASVTKYQWLLGVGSRHRGSLSWSNVLDRLESDLKTNEYDVIVVGGVPWKRTFSAAIRSLVLGQAERGAGLVVILDPTDTTDDLAAVLPMKQSVSSGLTSDPIWNHSSFQGEFRGAWRSAGGHFIVNGVPFDALPEAPYFRFARRDGQVIARAGDGDDALIAVGSHGKGRVVQMTYGTAKGWGGNRSLTPHVPYDTPFHYWEYYLSLVGRSMLWAAGREPDLEIRHLTVDGEEAVTIGLGNRGSDRNIEVTLTFRDERWRTVGKQEGMLRCHAGSDGTVTFAIPKRLAGGRYVADAIVRHDAKVLNWGSVHFTVTPAARIADHRFDREVYAHDQSVNVVLELAATDKAEHRARLKTQLFDTYDRLLRVVERDVEVSGRKEIAIDCGPVRSLTPFVRAEFELRQDDRVIARRRGRFLTRQPWRWDDYRPVMWSDFATTSVMEYLRPHYISKMREMGFDAIEDDSHFFEDFGFYCRQNMQPFPIGFGGSTSHGDVQSAYERSGDKSKLVRSPCLHDPAFLDTTRQHAGKVEALKDLNPLGYILADETSLTAAGVITYPSRGIDICHAPRTLDAFRAWIEAQYVTLDALNDQWETSFASWNEVAPATKEELFDAKSTNYSSWSDHRTFMEKSWHETYKVSVDVLREASPDVPVGLSGTSPPATYTGFDYSRLGRLFDAHWMYYTGAAGEMWRSFSPRGYFLSCQGYGNVGTKTTGMMWDTLLHGHKGTLYWTLPIFVNPDLTLTPDGEQLRDLHREVRSGIGKIIVEAERVSDPIAILYSQRSIQGAWITGAGRGDAAVTRYESLYRTEVKNTWVSSNEVRHLDNMDTYCNLLEGANLQYDFVSPSDVTDGLLEKRGCRVLILPWAMSISKAEAAAIESFVERGGTVIADVMPGIMDGHCRMLEQGGLDELFGVRTSGYQAVDGPGEVVCAASTFTEMPRGSTLRDVLAGPRVVADGATSHGRLVVEGVETDGLFVRRHGRGRAVLLNFLLSNRVDAATWANQSRLVSRILEESGVDAAVTVAADEPFVPYYEPIRFRQGRIVEYLAVLRRIYSSDREERITIGIEQSRHVYDVRKQQYVGLTDTFGVEIPRGEAAIFALLPYRVKQIDVSAPKRIAAGSTLDWSVRIGGIERAPGDHVVRVEFSDPLGDLVAPYSGNFLTNEGILKQSIAFALNDHPGTWRISAVDVTTGASGETTFVVQPRGDRTQPPE